MEVLGSLPTGIGLRRSGRLMEKPLADLTMVIDLEDEIEEDDEWEPEPVRSTATGNIAQREDEGKVDETLTEEDEKEGLRRVGTAVNPISLGILFENNVTQRVEETPLVTMDASSQGSAFVGSGDNIDDLFAFENDEDAFWAEVVALETAQKVDACSLHGNYVDLSSSDSGDDGDGEMGVIVEEPEELITTLSREDAAILAKIMKVIKEGGELKNFKTDHLKTYLRHYRLRMNGLKAVLLSRIQEHLKIKDGQAEELYPRSSFSLDCTGDVCLGDTVLFMQKVYDAGSFDIERRCASDPCLGQRWIAGKVISESYGEKKQQHTFTNQIEEGRRGTSVSSEPHNGTTLYASSNSTELCAVCTVSAHAEENVYQGSIPARTLSMQHGTYTERVVHQGFSKRYPTPEPTRHFHNQQSRYEGSAQAHHISPRIHVQGCTQHGRVPSHRQVYQGGMASRNSAHLNRGRQQEAMTIPCSNARCESLGAKQCISRSCGSCCRRNSTTRGRCPRHN